MVHEDSELYSVQEMAELLFGNTTPTSCYASHRLLSQERIFFKQAGRTPPRFQARSEKDVLSLKTKRLVEEKVLACILGICILTICVLSLCTLACSASASTALAAITAAKVLSANLWRLDLQSMGITSTSQHNGITKV